MSCEEQYTPEEDRKFGTDYCLTFAVAAGKKVDNLTTRKLQELAIRLRDKPLESDDDRIIDFARYVNAFNMHLTDINDTKSIQCIPLIAMGYDIVFDDFFCKGDYDFEENKQTITELITLACDEDDAPPLLAARACQDVTVGPLQCTIAACSIIDAIFDYSDDVDDADIQEQLLAIVSTVAIGYGVRVREEKE